MPAILDISGKPLPPRRRSKQQLRTQDMRDLSKVVVMLMIIIAGYFLFAPARDAAQDIRIAAAQKAQG
jgi:hypothetical protein